MARSVTFTVPRPGWRAIVAGALAVIVIGVLIVARLRGGGGPPPSALQPSAGTTSSASPSPGPPAPDDGVDGLAERPYSQKPSAAAMTAARAFVAAWADHPAGVTAATWWAEVSTHSTPVLRAQLKATDPQRVPATRITGAARGLSGGVSSATVAVPTDAGDVLLTCVLINGRWLVSDLDITREPTSEASEP